MLLPVWFTGFLLNSGRIVDLELLQRVACWKFIPVFEAYHFMSLGLYFVILVKRFLRLSLLLNFWPKTTQSGA